MDAARPSARQPVSARLLSRRALAAGRWSFAWLIDVAHRRAPFDDRECALLEEFAVESAIVRGRSNLMRALEFPRDELASKVAHLEARQEVTRRVGSDPDLDEVL